MPSSLAFGIFDHVARRAESPSVTYDSHLQVAARADALDYYGYHVAEHHGTGLSLAPSPSTFLAAVAVKTSRIRLGPLVYLLPLYNPLRVAEEVAMLDHLSGGRFELGVGRGANPVELSFFGVDVAESGDHFHEALDLLLLALEGGHLEHHSARYDFTGAELELLPMQQPHPPIWYPSSGTGRLPWAAERGYNTILNGTLEGVKEHAETFRAHLPEGCHPTVGVARYVVIGETNDDAERLAESALQEHLNHLLQLARARNLPVNSPVIPPSNVADARKGGWFLVGTPEAVAEQAAHVLRYTGCNYLVFPPLLGDLPLRHALDSLDTFSKEVIPAVRAALGEPGISTNDVDTAHFGAEGSLPRVIS